MSWQNKIGLTIQNIGLPVTARWGRFQWFVGGRLRNNIIVLVCDDNDIVIVAVLGVCWEGTGRSTAMSEHNVIH